jgi:hypothetical protein
MDTALLIVATVAFVIQMFAWAVLPNAKQVPEKSKEFSSIGDESKSKITV